MSIMNIPPFRPNLTGKVTPETKLAIDNLYDRIGKVGTKVAVIEGVAKSAARPEQIGAEASRQLNIAGTHPLNLEGLLGTLSQPQKAAASPVNSLPAPNDPLSQNGQIVYMNHRLYWFDGSTDPGVWRVLGNTTILDTHANRVNYPPADYQFSLYFETDRTVLYVSDGTNWIYVAGTYRAAQASRPVDLVAADIGFEFYATDLGRGAYWNGAAFVEAPKSLRIALDTDRINVAANEAMITGGGVANAMSISFGDDTTNYAIVFGTPVAGVFKARFAFVSAGGMLGYSGAGPTVTWQIGANGAFFPQNTNAAIYSNSGSPEGSITASVGSIFMRTDGAADTSIYAKISGSGNTGWSALRDTTLLRFGTGSPEGAVTAGVGSIFQRTDGGADSVVYVKAAGSGNTGWLALRDETLLKFGTGSPEGVITAGVGSVFQRTNGGPDSVIYVKASGSGNTGWLVLRDETLLKFGTGDPETVVTADVGAIFQRTDGGAGTSLYIKESGSGNTGWVAVNTSAGDVNSELEDHSGGLTLTTTYAASGISVTLNKDGVWMIVGDFDATVNNAAGLLEAALYVNGVIQTGVAVLYGSTGAVGDTVRASIARSWIYTVSGGATPVAELYARVGSTAGVGAGAILTVNSNILAVFLHS